MQTYGMWKDSSQKGFISLDANWEAVETKSP